MDNFINYIGVSNNLPVNISYFKEELFTLICEKKPNAKNIETIISSSIDCTISSISLLDTPIRTSNEGNKLSGKKLIVELDISYGIKYTSDLKEKFLYLLNTCTKKIIYVVVPTEINGVPIEDLLRKKKIGVKPFIEDLYTDSRNPNEVYIRTLLLTTVYIK